MHIVNLSNPRDIVRHSAVIDKDNSFNEIVRSVKQTSSGRTGLDISTEIQKMAENGIDALVKKLFSTEMKLFALDQEVTDLFKAIPTVACVEAQENVSFENGENDMENSSGVPTKAKKQRRRGRERKKTVT